MSAEKDGCLHLVLTCLKCLHCFRLKGCFHLSWQSIIAFEVNRRPVVLMHQDALAFTLHMQPQNVILTQDAFDADL